MPAAATADLVGRVEHVSTASVPTVTAQHPAKSEPLRLQATTKAAMSAAEIEAESKQIAGMVRKG